jgi:hypothetical protein
VTARPRSARLRAYGVLGAGSVAAGFLGALFDQVTVSVSPEYFIVGKGMSPQDLRLQVALLGFRSALPLGALVVGCGLLSHRSCATFRWSRSLTTVGSCVMCALPVGALVMSLADPFNVRPQLAPLLDDAASTRFLLCWGMHIAAYTGVLLGTAIASAACGRTSGGAR